jgi:hypothetical protein
MKKQDELNAIEKKTGRGFQIVEFKDYYGQECSLQMSSIVSPACIWLGVDNTGDNISFPGRFPNDGETNISVGVRMHLTDKQVRALLPYLKRFVKKDRLY